MSQTTIPHTPTSAIRSTLKIFIAITAVLLIMWGCTSLPVWPSVAQVFGALGDALNTALIFLVEIKAISFIAKLLFFIGFFVIVTQYKLKNSNGFLQFKVKLHNWFVTTMLSSIVLHLVAIYYYANMGAAININVVPEDFKSTLPWPIITFVSFWIGMVMMTEDNPELSAYLKNNN